MFRTRILAKDHPKKTSSLACDTRRGYWKVSTHFMKVLLLYTCSKFLKRIRCKVFVTSDVRWWKKFAINHFVLRIKNFVNCMAQNWRDTKGPFKICSFTLRLSILFSILCDFNARFLYWDDNTVMKFCVRQSLLLMPTFRFCWNKKTAIMLGCAIMSNWHLSIIFKWRVFPYFSGFLT